MKSCLLHFLLPSTNTNTNGTAENVSQESSVENYLHKLHQIHLHLKCCKVFHKYNGLALIFFLTPGEFVSLDPIVLPAKGGRAELLDVTALSELKLLQCERSIMCVALCRKG